MLKIEDVKVGDRLECLDIDLYLNLDDEWKEPRLKIIESSLIVDHIYDGSGLSIKDCELCIPVSDFKYFKKKEEQYTFDDLIDVAVQAVKDGLIACDDFKRHSISFCVAWDEDDGYELASHHDAKYFNEAIDFIQSLYKETFVIECEDDIKRIKKGAEITLLNGNKSKVKRVDDDSTLEVEGWDYFLQFFSLKGAKVEQSKG